MLFQPEIPWNTGNAGRTCVAAGASLHLIAPLGFSLSERRLKRAGLDYWPRLAPTVHEDFDAFFKTLPPGARLLGFTAQAESEFWHAEYGGETYLLFGRESAGLPPEVLARCHGTLRIPMREGERSLNLSTAVAVALYEGLRQAQQISNRSSVHSRKSP